MTELMSESADPPTYACIVRWIAGAGRLVGFPDKAPEIVCGKERNSTCSTDSLAAGVIRVNIVDPDGRDR
jgi:hypothetical protein